MASPNDYWPGAPDWPDKQYEQLDNPAAAHGANTCDLSEPAEPTAGPAAVVDDSGTDSDVDVQQLIQQAHKRIRALKQPKEPKPNIPKDRRAPRKAGAVSLKQLVDEGLLHAGPAVLYVEYKGQTTFGDLTEDGRIKYNELLFDSPSAFSIHLKRLVNPTRKADDGWKTVKYDGKLLEHYKKEYLDAKLERDFGEASPTPEKGAEEEGDGSEPPAKRQRVVEEEEDFEEELLAAWGARPKPAVAAPAPAAAPEVDDEATEDEAVEGMDEDAGAAAAMNNAEESVDGRLPPPRPRRPVKPPTRYNEHAVPEDEHTMVEPEAYQGVPGSGHPNSQPFKIFVHPRAEVVMDFHAHLSTEEVCGLLAGTYNAQTRCIWVQRALPVRNVPASTSGFINVEMDPTDEVRVQGAIEQMPGQQCVGWYHSHPHFQPWPSVIDIRNQADHQKAHAEPSGAEPFIATIVAPYDHKTDGSVSAMVWFYVAHPPNGAETAMKLATEPYKEVDRADFQDILPTLRETASWYTEPDRARARVQLHELYTTGQDRVSKLAASIRARLPSRAFQSDSSRAQYVAGIVELLKKAWSSEAAAAGQPKKRQAFGRKRTAPAPPAIASAPQPVAPAAEDDEATPVVSITHRQTSGSRPHDLPADGEATDTEDDDEWARLDQQQQATAPKPAAINVPSRHASVQGSNRTGSRGSGAPVSQGQAAVADGGGPSTAAQPRLVVKFSSQSSVLAHASAPTAARQPPLPPPAARSLSDNGVVTLEDVVVGTAGGPVAEKLEGSYRSQVGRRSSPFLPSSVADDWDTIGGRGGTRHIMTDFE